MKSTFALIFIFIFFSAGNFHVVAQLEKTEEFIYYQNKKNNPIDIQVTKNAGRYQFTAYNRSSYPYQLELDFRNLINLTPRLAHKEYKILPGKTNLITLVIVDSEKSLSYDYSVKYSIGLPSENVAFEHPYLIPVKNNFDLVYGPDDSTRYFLDCFRLDGGDTIFNMRKGYVAAVPDMYPSGDRISLNSSLEIIHEDGTIMIYNNINPDSLFVKTGEIVWPMQALGIINNQEVLEIGLYMNEGKGMFRNLRIHYCMGENLTERFSPELMKKEIVHPVEVITSEMTKREKRRYNKDQKNK